MKKTLVNMSRPEAEVYDKISIISNMSKHKFIIFFLALGFIFGSLLFFSPLTRAQQDSSDAIAVRVLPNPHHYSISRWYKEQGFKGSPQALTVDGYEAIRDGRTVYVNATNVIGTTIYTNIYLISYNQTANTQTSDVLGSIVSHWKFNENFPSASLEGNCNIGSVPCNSDKDCATGYKCSADASDYRNKCIPQNDSKCNSDTDCSVGVFCSSLKAKITRDIERVARLSELDAALANYRTASKRFPVLDAGTFVKYKTVSTWPSWREVLLPALSLSTLSDPINSMGYCPGFEAATCWNKNNNTFFEKTSDGKHLKFPAMSRVIYYSTDSNGSAYTLCAGMESPDEYNTSGNALSKFRCADAIINNTSAANTLPKIVDYQLNGISGQEFNGFIKVFDAENNPLTFNFVPTDDWSWDNMPVMQMTNNPNQIKLHAAKAGDPGNYHFSFSVNDGNGTMTTTTIPIKISESQVLLEAEDITHVLKPNSNLEYSFIYTGDGSLSKTLILKPGGGRDLGGFPSSLLSSTRLGENKYEIKMKSNTNDLQILASGLPFIKDETSVYTLDLGSGKVRKDVKVKLVVTPPVLDFNCPAEARVGRPYACFIGNRLQGDYTISYTASGLPTSNALILDNSYSQVSKDENTNTVAKKSWFMRLLSGLFGSSSLFTDKEAYAALNNPGEIDSNRYYIHNNAAVPNITTGDIGSYDVTITATNDFKTASTKSFNLKINSFCGDGVKGYPNTEGKGGYYNDGFEDCDGIASTTRSLPLIDWPANSSISRQYSCDSNSDFVYPIKNGSYCVFSSPLKGGGFKGDGLCETIDYSSGLPLETPINAPEDCGQAAGGSTPPGATCGDGIINQISEVCDCDVTNGQCDFGGKTCKDFNFWSVAPYGGLTLKCTSNCQFDNPTGADGTCLYPHQVFNNSVFTCAVGWKNCNNNVVDGCEREGCCPNCTNKQCGPDGCGGSCGVCETPPGQICKNGQCCQRNCTNKQCGADGCGGLCGTGTGDDGCPEGKVCTSNKQCKLPNCGNYEYCETGYLCCHKTSYEFCFPHDNPSMCNQGPV